MSVIKNAYLLNSTYNKEKIGLIFINILKQYSIDEFILLSDIIQLSTTNSIPNAKTLQFICGHYSILFEYNSVNSVISETELQYIITSLVVSVENSAIYNDLISTISFGKNKSYPTFSTLLEDITDSIELYKRYDTPFCVAKVCINDKIFGDKVQLKLESIVDVVSKRIRATDLIYRDDKSIYILLKNIAIENAITVAQDIKDSIGGIVVGVADWKFSYVIPDLFSEIDNYIYLQRYSKESTVDVTMEIDKILNNAIRYNHELTIAIKNGFPKKYLSNIVFEFNYKGCDYLMVKDAPVSTDINTVYSFNYIDIAEDVFVKLSNRNDMCIN